MRDWRCFLYERKAELWVLRRNGALPTIGVDESEGIMTNPVSPVSAEEPKLLSCPFCGTEGDRIIIQTHEPHTHAFATFMPDHPGSATIECGGCSVGMIADTKEKVIAAWNRRAPSGAKVPEGYALVPIEPTDEMALAAIKASLMHTGLINGVPQYKAMIAAAPLPPDPNLNGKP